MQKLKYTPGPWKIKDSISSICIAQCEFIQKIENIEQSMFIECFGENKEENARLISCAPEMFDILIKGYLTLKLDRKEIKDIIEKATGLNIEDIF